MSNHRKLKGITVVWLVVIMMFTPAFEVLHMFHQTFSGVSYDTHVAYADENEDFNYRRRDRCENVVTNADRRANEPGVDYDTEIGGVGSDNAWLVRGSQENAVAQEVFDAFVHGHGTSGAFAVGVITNIYRESRFVPDRAEFGGSGAYAVLRFGMNNPDHTSPEGPGPDFMISNAYVAPHNPYGLGGGGLFQFTPYTVFTQSQWWQQYDPQGWGVQNQVAHVWHESITTTAMTYVTSTNPAYGAAHYGRAPVFQELEDWLSTTDPLKAAEAFMVGHLRPAQYHPDNVAMAATANSVFNGDNIPADPSKWGDFGLPSSDRILDGNTSTGEDNQRRADEDECGDGVEVVTGNPHASWGMDFTGSHGFNLGANGSMTWRPADLPDHLWDYAMDPLYLGMEYGRTTPPRTVPVGWIAWRNPAFGYDYDQCTDFSVSMFGLTWFVNGAFHPGIQSYSGDGRVTASRIGNIYSDGRVRGNSDLTQQPSKGSVFSTQGGTYGHTGTVSHVFENGDYLIIEQNWPGYSGYLNGETATWNYRLLTSNHPQLNNMTFYSALEDNYEPNPLLTAGLPSGGELTPVTTAQGMYAMAAREASGKQYRNPSGSETQDVPQYVDAGLYMQLLLARKDGNMTNVEGRSGYPRTVQAQMNASRRVASFSTNMSGAQIGDLIFWGNSESSARHVAMYLGEHSGQHLMAHAKNSSEGIVIEPVSANVGHGSVLGVYRYR